jgi:hypothetical protein
MMPPRTEPPACPCPRCGDEKHIEWLSTWNEWQSYCPACDIRFNQQGDVLA